MTSSRPFHFFLALALCLCCLWAAPRASAQDATQVWNALSQAAFDPAKSAPAENVILQRDRLRITLLSGTIQFSQPANGVVFGAAFRGKGRVQLTPPNAMEAQQMFRFLGNVALELEFSEATFSFNDGTLEEVARQVKWSSGAAEDLASLYNSRQREREDVGAELLPRLFKGVLSADRARTAFFAADLKTSDQGWIHVRFDALDPEEITVGRWKNWGGATLFDTWQHFPAGNRSSSEAFRDPLAREDVNVTAYKIDATASASAELKATTNVHLEHRVTGERALLFQLDGNLRLQSVKNAQGAALTFFQPREPKDRNQSYGDYVAVVLPEAGRAGQSEDLQFDYSGKRVVTKVGSSNYFCQSFGWYPARNNSFAARADFEIKFHSPKKYTLVATGSKTGESQEGDWSVTTWKSDIPLAVAGFAYGDFKLQSEKAGTIDINIYANKEPDQYMQQILNETQNTLPDEYGPKATMPLGNLSPAALVKPMATEVANTVRLFEKYFGPFPYQQLAVTNIPYFYGQGWPGLLYLSSLSFLDSTQRNQFGIKDQIQLKDFFRAHESSHQWWGHKVGWKSYHDQWLSEGFAQFSGNLYVQVRQNQNEWLIRLREDKRELKVGDLKNRRVEWDGPIWMGERLNSSDSPGAYNNVIYNKGGLVLHMLRMMLSDPRNKEPDERFISMMQDFTATFNNKPASTEDFKAIAEKHITPTMDVEGNKKLDWFFRQYVYGTGIPEYSFTYRVEDAGGGKWKLSGTVVRTGGPENWKDVLPLYAQMSGKIVRLGWVSATQRNTPFELLLPAKPEKLMLNLFEDILAEIKQ